MTWQKCAVGSRGQVELVGIYIYYTLKLSMCHVSLSLMCYIGTHCIRPVLMSRVFLSVEKLWGALSRSVIDETVICSDRLVDKGIR